MAKNLIETQTSESQFLLVDENIREDVISREENIDLQAEIHNSDPAYSRATIEARVFSVDEEAALFSETENSTLSAAQARSSSTYSSGGYNNSSQSHRDGYSPGNGYYYMYGDEYSNTIIGGSTRKNYILGGDGNDQLTGGEIEDYIDGGNGNDIIYGRDGNDSIYGGAGDDFIDGGNGDDFLRGESGDDTIYGGNGDDDLRGGLGNDYLYGGDGDDALYGDGDDDVLDGGAGNDLLDGGAGNDLLAGGYGNDTFIYGLGYGHDTINAWDNVHDARMDVVKMKDLNPEDVEYYIENDDYHKTYNLVIKVRRTGETLTILGGLGSSQYYHLQKIQFANGRILTLAEISALGVTASEGIDNYDLFFGTKINGLGGNDNINGSAHNDIIYGDDGDDRLNGKAGDDILDGGAGNDILCGGTGSDTFIFGRGYGHDTISDYDTTAGRWDNIQLKGLNYEDVVFNISGTNLIITIKNTGETMTVYNGLHSNEAFHIQAVNFADGSSLTMDQIRAGGLYGTDNNETITIYQGATVYGQGGADRINGSADDDVIFGGDGNDVLLGNAGNDIIDGGAGNDTLCGGSGSDTFIFGRGYGHDTISDYDTSEGRWDKIQLKGLNYEDVVFNISGANLVVTIKDTGETMTILNGLNSNETYHIQAVEFADGKAMTMNQIRADGLHGTDARETITLNQGATVYGQGGDDRINGSADDDVIFGGDGNDVLLGNAGNDIIDGGAGNDNLYGGAGNDVFIFGRGYGHDQISEYDVTEGRWDTLQLKGLGAGDVTFNISGANLVVTIKDTGETMTILNGLNSNAAYHIQAVEFADGKTMSMDQIRADGLHGSANNDNITIHRSAAVYGEGGSDTINGSAYDDILYGGDGADRLKGNDGDDILDGGTGNDILDGGAGNDSYIFKAGYGQDTISNAGGGDDTLSFIDLNPADLWFEKSGNNLLIKLIGTEDQVTVTNWYTDGYSIDTIEAGGLALSENQVALMVQAMSAIGAPSGANGQWTEEQRDSLDSAIVAYWQPKM